MILIVLHCHKNQSYMTLILWFHFEYAFIFQEFIDFRIKRNKMLRSRRNQILLAFSFWGPLKKREGSNIYELRSYTLKVIYKIVS